MQPFPLFIFFSEVGGYGLCARQNKAGRLHSFFEHCTLCELRWIQVFKYLRVLFEGEAQVVTGGGPARATMGARGQWPIKVLTVYLLGTSIAMEARRGEGHTFSSTCTLHLPMSYMGKPDAFLFMREGVSYPPPPPVSSPWIHY